ncbi:sigma-b regulator rsbr [candidate division TA06 bacterium B3_TA06]|uniref:Sigma-b regulator rsbr n=1 Tax=candidate division TA06 bacterium B3_TA06 TaxID=2012487 RepID=A0A532V9P4_UNCT6|nr:MAG: sigma-b regulator rsbr [candidate division TA06 bacterium B3_TA06]
MAKTKGIADLESRIERMEEILSQAACGDFGVQIETDTDIEKADALSAVETGINLVISDMGEEVRESTKKAEELEEKLALIEQQRKAIEELSTPIIKIWERVLVLPLIGTLDTRRSQRLTESLLTDIAATQTKVTILDITGVPTVDSAVANHMLKTIAAVQLLGADCVITGIRPEVAQTMVHLGVDLSGVETLSTLAEGLKWAFGRLNIRMVEERKA